MRVALFCHSLLSDRNHGDAHFLRGVATELAARARVLAEHTGAHRAATRDRYVREIAGHSSIEEVSASAPEIIDP